MSALVRLALALERAPVERSALNPNGVPLQYCRSWSSKGSHLRVLADPATDRTDAGARLSTARAALAAVFREARSLSLLPLALHVLDRATADGSPCPDGPCWIGASLSGPGAAIYVDARRGAEAATREGVLAFGREIVADCAPLAQLLAGLPEGARPLCVGIEGSDASHVRFKVYWRLGEMLELSRFGDPLFADPVFAGFATEVIGDRAIRTKAIVASAGFALDGSRTDVKLDICTCANCARRPRAEWPELLSRLGALSGVAVDEVETTLALGEPGFVGLGLARDGARRLNLYLSPWAVP